MEKRLCRAVEAMIDPVTSESNTLTQSVGAYAGSDKPLSTVVDGERVGRLRAKNLLGRILDFGEGLRILTWTHPERLCFCFVRVFWRYPSCQRVQTQILDLGGRLYEFLYRLLPGDGSPMTTRLVNVPCGACPTTGH